MLHTTYCEVSEGRGGEKQKYKSVLLQGRVHPVGLN
jgi:hypothetical protein